MNFVREIFPKVFGSQWSEVIPQTNQPVLFEARTLLGMAMDNKLIDWNHGGETLHLIYCIEFLLYKLQSKGWNIIVVFFQILPYDHTNSSSSEQRLAVEILRQHLRSCSSIPVKNDGEQKLLQVYEFENWWEEKWRDFVIERHPSFIVLDLPISHSELDHDKISYEDIQKILLLDMLAQNIRSISSEFRVTSSIWSFELTLRLPYSTTFLASIHEELTKKELFLNSHIENDNKSSSSSISWKTNENLFIDNNMSTADIIITIALANILSNQETKTILNDLCKCFLLCNSIAREIPLHVRLQQENYFHLPAEDEEKIKLFFKYFTTYAFNVIQEKLSSDTDVLSSSEMLLLSDLIDGRLFYSLYNALCCSHHGKVSDFNEIGCSNDSFERIQLMWNLVNKLSSSSSSPCSFLPFELQTNIENVQNNQSQLIEKQNLQVHEDAPSLVRISDEFITHMNIEDIEKRIKENHLEIEDEKYQTFVSNENLEELAYYHVNLEDKLKEEERKKEEEKDKRPALNLRARKRQRKDATKQKQKYYSYTEKVSASLSGKGTVVHHIVSARSDAITLRSLKADLEEKKATATNEQQSKTKGGKGAAKGKGGGKGGKGGKGNAAAAKNAAAGKGAKGGKGKKGHINRKEQIMAKVREKQQKVEQDYLQLALTAAKEEEKTVDKILTLSKKLKDLKKNGKVGDQQIVSGYIQLIEWSMIQWREECVIMEDEEDMDDFEEIVSDSVKKYTGAIQVFRLSYDTVQLYAEHVSPNDLRKIQHFFNILGFPEAAKEIYEFYVLKNDGNYEKEAKYRPRKLSALEKVLHLKMSFACFQMMYCGHLMQRSFDSRGDERVIGFKPDAWQRELLDIVDSKQSALVVAPTSSGKTFISYYTMKQVIEANKKNKFHSKAKLVVYIAPTKALVRQVAAEVYAHYGPIVGIQTTSYEQSTENCQILVTVPQCLEELLLDPTWDSKRIAYCILDEIHCIQEFGTGEQSLDEGGSIVWEHVINLLPCPFLALSATIGNPQCFRDWLSFSQERYHREVRVVTHKYRWADLKLQVYIPNTSAAGDDDQDSILNITTTTEPPKSSNLSHLHPLAALSLATIQEGQSIFHLRISPEECYQLYSTLMESMEEMLLSSHVNDDDKSLLKEQKTILESSLKPEDYFQGIILRYDVFEYEYKLKELIVQWSNSSSSIIVSIISKSLHKLCGSKHSQQHQSLSNDHEEENNDNDNDSSSSSHGYPSTIQFTYDYFLPLLVELHNDNKLPALIFSLDRHRCNRLVTDLIHKLEELENNETQKPEYQRKLREYLKAQQKKGKKNKRKRDEEEKQAKHASEVHDDEGEGFEVEIAGKDERFSFLRKGEGALEEDKEFWISRIQITGPFIQTLVNGLDRGIGVHHGALPSAYRTAVEVLFRGGHLKVVISTGTLSLGINMPCKTVVFAGDSHALTPLSFQQMSGRAGRRGYDDYGNIVFFGISQYRVFSLLCAQLTTLTGGQPINPTVTLRLLNCYYQTAIPDRKEIADRLRGLLSPSLYSTNLSSFDAKIHRVHSRWLFRIYVDTLIRLPLLEKNSLVPTNIASLTMKLYNTEPSNLLMSYFFLSDTINDVCNQVDNQQARINNLFLLLCHIFRPIPVTPYLASLIKQSELDANSLIVLPSLHDNHQSLLQSYNSQIIQQFVKCILAAHEIHDDEEEEEASSDENNNSSSSRRAVLPFSGIFVGCKSNYFNENVLSKFPDSLTSKLHKSTRKVVIRSPFVALSGHSDEFQSAQELTDTCNLSLPIDIDQIPAFSVQDIRGRNLHLNAYAWDFLKHGKRQLLVHENGFKEANAWELIRDWSEILQKLSTYLTSLPTSDDDRLKRVCQLFEFLHKEFQEKFERFNN